MSELTAAGAALVAAHDLYLHAPGQAPEPCLCRDYVAAIEAEAAARAVDEALSVERVAEWLHDADFHPCTGQYETCRALGEPVPSWSEQAAALVAHLRGPRPEGEG